MVTGGREGSESFRRETSDPCQDHTNAIATETHPMGPVPQPAVSAGILPSRQPAHEGRSPRLVGSPDPLDWCVVLIP